MSSTKSAPPDFSSRLFLNNMSLKQFNLFTGTVLLICGVIFLLSSMSPMSHITRTRPVSDCNPWIYSNLGLTCSEFSLDKNPIAMINIADLNQKNKFVTLDIVPFRKSSNLQSAVTLKVQVSVYTIQENDPSVEVSSPETLELTFDCSDSHSSDCGTETVLTLKNLKYKSYYILLNFINGQELSPLISDFAFTTTTLNTTYKNYVFFVKIFFMLASFGGYVFYIIKTFSMKKEQESNELKSLELLFPFLLLINEPFTSQMFGGIIYSWIIIAAFAAFSACQIRLWILATKQITGSDPSIFSFDDKMLKTGLLVYGGITWMTYLIYQGTIPPEPGSEFLFRTSLFFNLFRIPLFAILGFLIFYMVKSTQVILKKSDPENERENYFFWFSAFFFIAHILLVALGGLNPISHDGPKQLLFSGLSTLYILSASYLYLPNKDGGALSPATASKPANARTKGSYMNLDDSHEFAPQTGSQGNLTGRGKAKSPAGAVQENYPPEIKAEDDF